MNRKLQVIFATTALILLGCAEKQWIEKEVGSSGVFVSFPPDIEITSNVYDPEDRDFYFARLTGALADEDTRYIAIVNQRGEPTLETESYEDQYLESQHLEAECEEEVPPNLDQEVDWNTELLSKEIVQYQGKKAYFLDCRYADFQISTYTLTHKNLSILLLVHHPISIEHNQSEQFLDSLLLPR